ncbi:MAG TPA: Hpt domain-containing protein, partial [Luteimonas sp.]|nr:Hpt domain-containing protein [Luteimonas sp.]
MTTALRDAIDYTTLGWVKPELDETLRLARIEIEAFAENPEAAHMATTAARLHEVQGTLRMVELYAPARVAEEMELLAEALRAGRVAARDDACATLMRGVVLLPDYLERLQGGHKDIPVVLLPLLNEVRAIRGEPGLDESALFSPGLQRPLPEAFGSGAPVHDAAGADELLAHVDQALSAWPEGTVRLASALESLFAGAADEGARRMYWVASAIAAAVRDGAMAPTPELRDAFAEVAAEARRQSAPQAGVPVRAEAALEPARKLLYQVAQAGGDHPSLRSLRDTFDLDLQATETELAHAQGSLAGHNRALLDTVSAAIKEDLLRVKDALDLHVRSGQAQATGLAPQAAALGTIADTLGMLGLDAARTLVQQQRDALGTIVAGDRGVDEAALLDIASALLYVDASLDEQVERLGGHDADADALLASESRKVTEVLAREAIANFADARQAFVAFVETGWEHGELVEVPRLLGEVAGALQMLDLPQPAQYLAGVRAYTDRELLGKRRVPSGRQLDTLADALASLEYYLEALREQRGNREDILDIARNSLEALGYWPIPEAEPAPAQAGPMQAEPVQAEPASFADAAPGDKAGDEAPATATHESAASAPAFEAPAPVAAQSTPVVQVAPVVPVPAVHASAPVGAGNTGGFEVTGDEIDDEIREIFLEEFEEEIGNLRTLLPEWRQAPEELDRLRPIRRVFHTLKGSGRLVGARVLGEFAWKTENMLNRVLDGSRPPSAAVIALVDHSHGALPGLLAALRGDAGLAADLPAIQAVADRVAAGEEVFYQPAVETPAGDQPAEIEAVADIAPDAGTMALEPVVDAPVEAPAETPAPAGIPASVDQVLLEILDAEVGGHLVTVDRWLQSAGTSPAMADDTLLRAIHTMNGAFAMTEVPSITEAMTPAEAWLKRLVASHGIASPEGVAALAELADAVRGTVAGLHAPVSHVPDCSALAARLVALRDSLPDVAPADEYAAFGVDFDDEESAVPAEAEPLDHRVTQALDADALARELAAFDASPFGDLAASLESAAPLAPQDPQHAQDAIDAQVLEAERAAAERAEAERAEAERLEAERAEAERLEAERLETERAEAERLEAERLEAERLDAERAEAERVEAARAEAARLADERFETERVAAAERVAAEPVVERMLAQVQASAE